MSSISLSVFLLSPIRPCGQAQLVKNVEYHGLSRFNLLLAAKPARRPLTTMSAAERRLQLRHHSEIGPETARGDDNRPSRELIAAAVGILYTDTSHTTIYSRQQSRHLV